MSTSLLIGSLASHVIDQRTNQINAGIVLTNENAGTVLLDAHWLTKNGPPLSYLMLIG